MKITIGSDHGAVELKEVVKKVLSTYSEIEVNDVGTFSSDAVDYRNRHRHFDSGK